MVNSAENYEDIERVDSQESKVDAKKTSEKYSELEQIEKQREKVIDERKKPSTSDLERQVDTTTEILVKERESEEVELEKELLKENLEKGGLKLSQGEITEIYEALPDMVAGISPEFSEYMVKMLPRIEVTLEKVEKFKKEGNEYKGIETLANYISEEMKDIEKIKDEEAKNQILSFISSTIDVEKVIEDIKKQATVEGAVELTKIAPVIGPGIELAEAVRGRSAAGEKLSGGKRVMRAATGTAFMVLDIAGIATAGGTTAVRAGVTAVKAGKGIKDSVNVATTAYKTAKVASKASKALSLSGQGLKIGKTVTRFAALTRKTTKLRKVSKSIFKIGKLIQKYPRLAGAITRTVKMREAYKKRRVASSISKSNKNTKN